MWYLLSVFFMLVSLNLVKLQNSYTIPRPKVFVTTAGLRVSIPDELGIESFLFHGNINEKIGFLDSKAVIISTTTLTNGEWLLKHNRHFNIGDVIYYWVYVKKDGVGYTSGKKFYQVKEIYPEYEDLIQARSNNAIYEQAWDEALASSAKDTSVRDEQTFPNTKTSPKPRVTTQRPLTKNITPAEIPLYNGEWVWEL